jgi:L-serine dehydratase
VTYSVFDMFKIGIGPSSSHTVGPMVAAGRFVDHLEQGGVLEQTSRVCIRLYGSLAFTATGHGSDKALLLGLDGELADQIDPDFVENILTKIRKEGAVRLAGRHKVTFNEASDIVFDYGEPLPGHSNGMRFLAYADDGAELANCIYYSIGGGFVADDAELASPVDIREVAADLPYAFHTAEELLLLGRKNELRIDEMMAANERALRDASEVDAGLDQLWDVMHACMARGMSSGGVLPGGLKVRRRARKIYGGLLATQRKNMRLPHECMDWISLYAIAVNEENASGGRIVTAPTNGAAGVIPAVIRYYLEFVPDADQAGVRVFLLASAAIGSLIKTNASISGAEAGCQGEVGSACAMAAAGLAAALGGSNEQVENAAEIGLEHHLGMTCDPVGGLVQVPCIERNAMGAVKAINAASLALMGDGEHFVSLDAVVETMRQTGEDMQSKYKETSQGGLAVNVVEC